MSVADKITSEFERWYNRTFATKGVDTKHINDCEEAYRAGRSAQVERIEKIRKQYISKRRFQEINKRGVRDPLGHELWSKKDLKLLDQLLEEEADKLFGTVEVQGVERDATVEQRVWAADDKYLVIGEIQVFEQDGFKRGDSVTVTITRKPS